MILIFGILFLPSIALVKRVKFRPLPVTWVTIPAGEFLMGSTDEELAKAKTLCQECSFLDEQLHKVYLDPYEIMAYEVTIREYTQCVNAGVCPKQKEIETDSAGEKTNLPKTFVKWENAQEYCVWIGGRLPTEAEWEKAARGGLSKKFYPWGDEEPNCDRANS
jgi:formylglycine-generating enzyme required for sulfatase activity